MKLTFLVTCLLLLLSACTGAVRHVDTKYANYLPDDKQLVQEQLRADLPPDQKATLEFTTNTSDNTYFRFMPPRSMCGGYSSDQVNVRRGIEFTEEAQRIRKLASLGLLPYLDAKIPKSPHRVIKEFPAGEELIIHAGIFEHATNVKIECGPLHLKFRPEATKTYRLSMESTGGRCRVDVVETRRSESPVVPPHAVWQCTASLTGFDGNKVFGYRDHPGQ